MSDALLVVSGSNGHGRLFENGDHFVVFIHDVHSQSIWLFHDAYLVALDYSIVREYHSILHNLDLYTNLGLTLND